MVATYSIKLVMALVVIFGVAAAAHAAPIFTRTSSNSGDPDRSGWQSSVGTTEAFTTSAANIAKADEVALTPADPAYLGTSTLTFDKANTGLTGSFTLSTPNTDFHFRTFQVSYATLEASQAGVSNDDWELVLDTPVTAIGFTLISVNDRSGDIHVYDANDNLLGSTTASNSADNTFIGIEANGTPISRVVWDDDTPGSDSNSVGNFEFIFVPEPASVALMGLGYVLVLSGRRRRRLRPGSNGASAG